MTSPQGFGLQKSMSKKRWGEKGEKPVKSGENLGNPEMLCEKNHFLNAGRSLGKEKKGRGGKKPGRKGDL